MSQEAFLLYFQDINVQFISKMQWRNKDEEGKSVMTVFAGFVEQPQYTFFKVFDSESKLTTSWEPAEEYVLSVSKSIDEVVRTCM